MLTSDATQVAIVSLNSQKKLELKDGMGAHKYMGSDMLKE